MTVYSRVILVGVFIFTANFSLRALDGPTEFTVDLPFGESQATPSWLGHPSTPAGTFATLDLPITPPDATASLLVTVFYQEESGGFLRISWQGSAGAPATTDEIPGPGEIGASSLLCDNFYEGIGMSNQRSLLVSADTMKQAGMLHFQAGDSTLGISRIKLEWLENSTGLSSPAITDVLVTSGNGRTQLASELAGTPPTTADPAWHDRVVNVPITDVPLRIEQGVDFTVHMDSVPAMARLALKETGLPWGQHLVVWLNNKRAGVIAPAVPALGDEGYSTSSSAAPYIGWREGTFFVPLNTLATGNNVLQFSTEADGSPGTPPDSSAASAPLAVKDVCFELNYSSSSMATSATTSTVPAQTAPDTTLAVPAPNASSTPETDPPVASTPPNKTTP